MSKDTFTFPPELFACKVYSVVDIFTDGVPEMTPFVIVRPVGRAGSISHETTFPPVLLATRLVIATPLV